MIAFKLVVGIAAAGFMIGAGQAGAQGIRTATSWPGGPHLEHFAQGFAKQAEILTAGKVKFQIFPAGTIGSPLKITESVQKKVASAGHTWPGYDWGIDKTAAIFGPMAASACSRSNAASAFISFSKPARAAAWALLRATTSATSLQRIQAPPCT